MARKHERRMRPLEVRTLGHFGVFMGGEPLRFGRKTPSRPLLLLKYLAASGGEASGVHVAAALWPEAAGAGLRSLAVNVHRLRRLLGTPAAIVHVEGRLALDGALVWCDAVAFEAQLDAAEAATTEEAALRLYARALALYGGEFLLHHETHAWLRAARRRLRNRFVHACAVLGGRLGARGHWDEARICYLRGLEVDERAEHLCVGLMRACAALGEPAEGAVAFRRLQRSLARRERTRPAAATRALYESLTAQEC